MATIAEVSNLTVPNVGGLTLLADLVAGNLATAKVDIYTNDITPDADSVIGDFDIAAYTGYTQKTVTGYGSVHVNEDGKAEVTSTNVMEFKGPVAGGGPDAYGFVVRSAGAGTPLLMAARFSDIQPLTDATKTVEVVIDFRIPSAQ